MEKSLSTRIAERTGLHPSSKNTKNRAAFLALKPDIKQAIEDGWPVKTIWETLHAEGKITFSYQAFRGYVNRLILACDTTRTASIKNSEPPVKNNETAKPSTEIKGFIYNSTPNLEELF